MKNEKGMTLMNLIVTIVSLFILAAIAISLVIDDNYVETKNQNTVNVYTTTQSSTVEDSNNEVVENNE